MTRKEKDRIASRARYHKNKTEEKRIAKNERDRAIYAAKRLLEPAKKRGRKPKAQLPKPVKPAKLPPVRVLKPITVSTPKAVGKVLPTMKQDLSKKVKLLIPELRLTVYITKDQDPEQIRKKYLRL